MMTKERLLVLLVGSASLLALSAAALACTVIVSGTNGTTGTSSAHQGGNVNGDSTVVESQEDDSNCDDGSSARGCNYSLGVVNPAEVNTPSSGGTGPSATCHYETIQSYAADSTTEDGPQFATIADHDSVDHDVNGGTTELAGSGTLGDFNGSFYEDDAGDQLTDGDTMMCFYSSEAAEDGANPLNNAEDGAAAATDPMNFKVL